MSIVTSTSKPSNHKKTRSSNKIAVYTLPTITLPEEETSESCTNATVPSTDVYGTLIRTRKVEMLCQSIGMTQNKIRKLRNIFDRCDVSKRDMVSSRDFLTLIQEEQCPLTNGIFRFADQVSDEGYIQFDDFLQCIVRFATLTKLELIQFLFDLYDVDRSGSLNAQEFDTMSRELQSPRFSYPINTEIAIGRMKKAGLRLQVKPDSDESKEKNEPVAEIMVDRLTFIHLARSFPVAIYPIFNMQNNVHESTFGQRYWTNLGIRKNKIRELHRYLRQSRGELPKLTWWEMLSGIFGEETKCIREAAVSRYRQELQDLDESS